MIRNFLISVTFLIMMSTMTYAHQAPSGWTYDMDCCGENDCEPVKVLTDDKGNFAILKNGQKWYIDKPNKIRPSQDENFHVCIYLNQVWCLYAPAGG